MEIVEI